VAPPVGRCGLCFWDVEPGEPYAALPPAEARPGEGGHLRCILAFAGEEDVRPAAIWLRDRARAALKALGGDVLART
jgi:hypothetical protein